MLPILKSKTQLRFYFTRCKNKTKQNNLLCGPWIGAGEIELMPRKVRKDLRHGFPPRSSHWKIHRRFSLLKVSLTNLLHGFSKWHQCDNNLEVLCSWQIFFFFFPFNHHSEKGGGLQNPSPCNLKIANQGMNFFFFFCLHLENRISCFDSCYVNKWV